MVGMSVSGCSKMWISKPHLLRFQTLRTLSVLAFFAGTAAHGQEPRRPAEVEALPAKIGPAMVDSGRQIFISNCSFCHGVNARGGGQGGPDLARSNIVQSDENGNELGGFLKVGRPDKGMPAFNLATDKVQAIAAFLHSVIRSASQRHAFGTEVLIGDPAAGKAFFDGEGKCIKCHSVTRDLKGVGSRYEPAVLQGHLVLPIGDGGYPGGNDSAVPRIQVTVAQPDGKTKSGLLVYLSDYALTLIDSSGERLTIPRHDGVPKISIDDPLQAHLDRQLVLTDKQMHDLNAYLATLK